MTCNIMIGLISALPILLFTVWMLLHIFYYDPKKERKEGYKNKAFELTKEIGNKNIRCISVELSSSSNYSSEGKAYYLIEENAENDSTKYCVLLDKGRENSAHTIKNAKRNVEAIIKLMPYNLYIENTGKSIEEFFKSRKHDEKMRDLQYSISCDEDHIVNQIESDFYDKKLSVIRLTYSTNEGINKGDYYCYLLEIEFGEQDRRYLDIFDSLKTDVEYATIRINHFIDFYNSNIKDGTKICKTINCIDRDFFEFLRTEKPIYTKLLLYKWNSTLDK